MENNKEFKELNANTDWKHVLDLIRNDNFSSEYKDYEETQKEKGYFIERIRKGIIEKSDSNANKSNSNKADEINDEKEYSERIFLFDEEKKIKIYLEDELFGSIKIYSSLEIITYIKAKNKDINNLYIKGEPENKFLDCIEDLGVMLENLELELIEKTPLPALELKSALPIEDDYTPEEYSPFFYDYFIYEDKQKMNEKIIFQNNDIRKKIYNNIVKKLRTKKELKTFKFTGPSSIGKSFTLFRISRICYNIAYINLKVLNDKKNLFDSYSIIMSEIKRFNIKKNLKEIETLINNNYNQNIPYLDMLLNLIEYLNKIKFIFVFIFDQFKPKYVTKDFMNKIKSFENIKIVQCSSINDKEIREECITTWTEKGKNILDLDKNNQDYYLYYGQIYIFKRDNNILLGDNIIFIQFDYMPKYIKKYKNYVDRNSIYNDAKKDIRKKINEFCESYKLEKSLVYSNLKYIVNKDYNCNKFEEVIKYCPLKYYIILFDDYNQFQIKPIFPFMQNVINYEYTEIECYNYFKNEVYKRDSIVNNLIKGDYFEASVKFELRKLDLPEKKNYHDITLYEIISMDKIIYDKNKFYIEDIEENKKSNLEKNKKSNSEENKKESEKDDINENNLDINNIEEYKYPDKEGEEIDIDKENNEDEEEEEEFEEENEDEGNEAENKCGKDFENLLKEFKINFKKNDSNKTNLKGLSKDARSFSKTIEDYRYDEINEQRKENQEFNKSLYSGDESIFLDQFSKFGKTLDFAYLYGRKDKKVFIGFQMKCYFEKSNLDNKFVDKSYIKKSCRKILVNSMKLFNCKITEWHYYLIFYYNKNNSNENVSQSNIAKCKLKDISYFFYDPIEKEFYNTKGNKLINITKLKIDQISNLENNVADVNQFAFEIEEKRKIEIGEQMSDMRATFIKDLSMALNINDEEPNILKILSQIASNIGMEDHRLFFHMKCEFNKSLICPKKDKYILLYKKKVVNGNIGFIASIKRGKKIKYIDISTKEEVNEIYEAIDEKSEYYYCLNYCKRANKKVKKRTYNQLLKKIP